MRPLTSLASAVLVFGLAATSSAPAHSETRPEARPELDALSAVAPSVDAAARLVQLRADATLARVATISQVDDQFGVPTFVWGVRSDAQALAVPAGATLETVARGQLARLAPFYGLSSADVRGAVARRPHDTGRGGVIVAFRQVVNGVSVFGEELKVMLDRSSNLIAAAGFIASSTDLATAATASFRLDDDRAVQVALADFTGAPAARGAFRDAGLGDDGYRKLDVSSAVTADRGHTPSRPARVRPVWFHEPGRLKPAYYVEIAAPSAAYAYVISADDGALLVRHSQMAADSYGYRVWADDAPPYVPLDGPQGNGLSPHPTGTPSRLDPPFVPTVLHSLTSGPIGNGDPWLPPGATETVGNNVDAYADFNYPDGLTDGDYRATLTGPGAFDRAYDPALPPDASDDQRKAAITQLFYDANFFHDWYYDAGFDEGAGNAQQSNYGRGGVEHDPLIAQCDDWYGYNNAGIYTPADGASPEMTMFVFVPNAARVTVLSPQSIAGEDTAGVYVPVGPYAFDLTGDVVYVDDGVAPNGDACQPTFTNVVAGKIALIDRGDCTYDEKVEAAQDAGAIGVLIVNNLNGNFAMTGMFARDTIPVLSISKQDGAAIKAHLAEGVSIRMQRQWTLRRESAIDNQIIAHEWGHLISNRLISDAGGLINAMGFALGEGYADFQALLMTVREEDAATPAGADYAGTYSIGAYALSNDFAPGRDYYFGIRRVPYSIDFSKNALTLRHMQTFVGLPVGPPTAFGSDGSDNAEAHNAGEVWCSMLWECYAAMLRDHGRLTFAQARDRMRDYLVASYKMVPFRPTLTEARDAMLAAAFAGDRADYDLFCQAFARRGAGTNAVAPGRFSQGFTGIVESYTCLGGDLVFDSVRIPDDPASCDRDGYLDNDESSTVVVALRNTGGAPLVATTGTVTTNNLAVSFPAGHTLSFPMSLPGRTVRASLPIHLSGAVGPQTLDFFVDFDDPGLAVAGTRQAQAWAYGNVDETPSSLETVESQSPGWTIAGSAVNATAAWRRVEIDGSHHVFRGPDTNGLADQYLVSPPLQVAPAGDLVIQFSHAYQFEASGDYTPDGGVIELSEDEGSTWMDIGASVTPGYNGNIGGTPNPLNRRAAFVGTSPGYPALMPATVNLGTRYAFENVLLRFRVATDGTNGAVGWDVDDIEVMNITNRPFKQLITDGPTPTTAALSAGTNLARLGTSLELVATVLPAGSFGTVTFYDAGTAIGTADVDLNRHAVLGVSGLAVGPHGLTATYFGNPCFAASTAPVCSLHIVANQAPVVAVTSPNGGEDLTVGAHVPLTWTASDDGGLPTVALELSRNGGVTWESIADQVPNTGTYNWTVTGPGTNQDETLVYSALARVIAEDDVGQVMDASNAPFSIFDTTTPTVVTRLDAETSADGVTIRWSLSRSGESIAIERAPAEAGPWAPLDLTTSREGDVTVAVDRTAPAGRTFWYRLRSATRVLGVVRGTAGAPAALAIGAAWPNPTPGAFHAELAIPTSRPVRLSLVDLQGREIQVLAEGWYAAGHYQVAWDGRTDRGTIVPNGLYFLRLHTPREDRVTRLVVAR